MLKAFSSARKLLQIVVISRSGLVIRSRFQIDVLSEISRRQTFDNFIKNVSFRNQHLSLKDSKPNSL